MTAAAPARLGQSVLEFARKDFTLLDENLTIQEALEAIRRQGIGERVIYFYVVDGAGKLTGVLPTRRLLTSPAGQRLAEVTVRRVAAIPQAATMLEACESFVLHKFLAFPVVDSERRVVGVVDLSLLTEELLDQEERPSVPLHEPVRRPDDLFEMLGFHLAQLQEATAGRAFRVRFPWLLATVGSGTVCAMLSGMFETTLAKSLVLTFFLTMVLGLNESVSIQSMTLTIQALRSATLSWRWYFASLRREAAAALLLGGGCGAAVSVIVWLWRRDALAAGVIGGSIFLSLITATLFGLTVPALLHALRLDPKIAAGPVTLALADICALLFYFNLARLAL